MWTERERVVAKQLDNEETWALLEKVFTLATSEQLRLKARYSEMSNEQFGELMKVIELSRKENLQRIALLKTVAKGKKEKKDVAIAPK